MVVRALDLKNLFPFGLVYPDGNLSTVKPLQQTRFTRDAV
jgi:hypothetical protein